MGQMLSLRRKLHNKMGNDNVFFEGRLCQCRPCDFKQHWMRNPSAADDHTGRSQQVSFIIHHAEPEPNYTEWMKTRIDSEKGKQIYNYCMSVIKPVFDNIKSNKGLNRFSVRDKR